MPDELMQEFPGKGEKEKPKTTQPDFSYYVINLFVPVRHSVNKLGWPGPKFGLHSPVRAVQIKFKIHWFIDSSVHNSFCLGTCTNQVAVEAEGMCNDYLSKGSNERRLVSKFERDKGCDQTRPVQSACSLPQSAAMSNQDLSFVPTLLIEHAEEQFWVVSG